MIEFLQRFFGRPSSSATARERLRLVLLSDHLSLAPDVVEALKHDLIDVISRYCDVDVANCDVTFEQQDKQVAMLANIPILGMRNRPKPPAPVSPPASPAPEPPSLGAGVTAAVAADTTVLQPSSSALQPAPHIEPKPVKTSEGQGKSRRRRRKKPMTSAATQGA